MVIIVLSSLGLLACFYLLAIICEDYFVQSLEAISRKLKLSPDVAGATFMAIGSSAPELFTSLIALTKIGSENIGAGAIVGSAIFNILVIVGISAVVATAYLNWRPVFRDLIFYIISILILLFTFRDGRITLPEVGLYLGTYLVYLVILAFWSKWFPPLPEEDTEVTVSEPHTRQLESSNGGFIKSIKHAIDRLFDMIFPSRERYVLVFLLSVLLIGGLSWCLVELAILLARALSISEVIIALTVLAAGTSVPDLLSSVIVARKGKGDMAVSNAVGSNIFDILIGLGVPWMLYLNLAGKELEVKTENLISSVLLLFFTVIALLALLAAQKFRIGRWSGLFLIALYIGYLVFAIYTAFYPEQNYLEQWIKTWWS